LPDEGAIKELLAENGGARSGGGSV
jgi:hypothetical protein